MERLAGIALLGMLAGCGGPDPGPGGALGDTGLRPTLTRYVTETGFDDTGIASDDMQRLVDRHCGGCHVNGGVAFDLRTSVYDATVGVQSPLYGMVRVVPGDLEGSLLYRKVAGRVPEGMGQPMPQGTRGLPEPALEAVERWILRGAPR